MRSEVGFDPANRGNSRQLGHDAPAVGSISNRFLYRQVQQSLAEHVGNVCIQSTIRVGKAAEMQSSTETSARMAAVIPQGSW